MPFLKSNKIHSIYVDEHKTVISTAGVKTAVYIHYSFLGITKGLHRYCGLSCLLNTDSNRTQGRQHEGRNKCSQSGIQRHMYLYHLFIFVLFLLLCLCILIVMHVLFCIFCFHRANWHSSATLLFPHLYGKCQGFPRKDGARPALFPIRQ